ncbi:methyl-accepting chemotaxis protein [Cohnella faecalis]
MNVSRKMIAAFLAIAFTVAAASGLSYLYLQRVNDSYREVLAREATVSDRVFGIETLTERQKGVLFRYLTAPSQQLEKELRAAWEALNVEIAALSDAGLDEQSRQLTDKMKESNATFARLADKVTGYVNEGKADLARTEALMWAVPTSDELSGAAAAIRENERAFKERAESDNAGRVTLTKRMLLGSSAVAIALALAVGWALSRIIVRPIRRLSVAAERIAAGDLTDGDLAFRGRDELAGLAASFNGMKANLRELIRRAGDNAGQVADASGQLRANSEQIGGLSERVSAAIEQIAASMDEQTRLAAAGEEELRRLAASAEEMEASAVKVNDRSASAQAAAEAGKSSVGQALAQMESIRSGMETLASLIERLDAKSNEIDNTVDIISIIARQTNILALNASIEAARAGVQGRGFAVVAEEVRKLAAGTANAAAEISAMLHGIRSDMGDVSEAMEAGRRDVSGGMAIVQGTEGAFLRIDEAVRDVAVQAGAMAGRSSEMAARSRAASRELATVLASAGQIAVGAQEASAGTQEQYAAMEEMIASTVQLSREAERLKEGIAGFRV